MSPGILITSHETNQMFSLSVDDEKRDVTYKTSETSYTQIPASLVFQIDTQKTLVETAKYHQEVSSSKSEHVDNNSESEMKQQVLPFYEHCDPKEKQNPDMNDQSKLITKQEKEHEQSSLQIAQQQQPLLTQAQDCEQVVSSSIASYSSSLQTEAVSHADEPESVWGLLKPVNPLTESPLDMRMPRHILQRSHAELATQPVYKYLPLHIPVRDIPLPPPRESIILRSQELNQPLRDLSPRPHELKITLSQRQPLPPFTNTPAICITIK